MDGTVRYRIEHVSRYRYTARVRRCTMLLCLEPRDDRGQRLFDFELETSPTGGLTREEDSFGNARHVLDISQGHRVLEIKARSTVEAKPPATLPNGLGAAAWRAIRSLGGSFAYWDFMHPSALVSPSSALGEFVARHRIEPGADPLESLLRLSDTLHRCLHYIPGATSAESPVDHVFQTDRGVCQDYAHAMIAIARSWGIPARYVSGYLHVSGQSGQHLPANATHAWVECRLPELGWIGFDPTNRSLAGTGHVRIAAGRDYRDVSPTRGVIQGGGDSRLEVDVRMHTIDVALVFGQGYAFHHSAPIVRARTTRPTQDTSQMDIQTERNNGTLIAKAEGRIDGVNARDFEEALKAAISADDDTVVMDLEGLSYISSAGLRVILLIAKTLRKRNAELVLCSLSDPIREVFEISGFDKIIPVHASREQALAAIGG